MIALTSTVLPGSTRYGLLPVLEAESGKDAVLILVFATARNSSR